MCTLSRTAIDNSCRLEDCVMNSSSSSVTPKMSQQDYNILTRLPGNRSCIDCGNAEDTEWASVSYGVVLCTSCSHEHKSLLAGSVNGIRSIKADEWTPEELLHMKLGGNERFRSYLDMRDVDLAATPLQQRYTCQAAKDYRKSLQEMVQEEISFDESMNGSMVFEKPQLGKSADEQDSGFIFRAINSLVSPVMPAGSRSRTCTEESISVEEDEQADQEEEVVYPADLQQEANIISRIISRQPVTSLDVNASKMVRQCLEENKDNQSILYKWTASNMTPTVSHMGRKYQVDDHQPTTSQTLSQTAEEASFVARMGLSWNNNGSDHTNHYSDDESDSVSQQEYKEHLRELSDSDFSKLKSALKQKGVRTNLCLDLLYSVAKSSCSLPEPKRPTVEAASESVRSRWELLQDATATTAESDDEDMPSHIIISRCA